MDMVVLKNEVWMTKLEPTIGSEINITRPCIIVSPDIANMHQQSVVIIPLTSKLKDYPSRVKCTFQNKQGQIVINQIRTIDKTRLVKKLGIIDDATSKKVYEMIKVYFK
jgi:mRNA interferase MazF